MNKLETININKEPIKIKHSELERRDNSLYRSVCPVCKEGALMVERDFNTFELVAEDICILCGQKFIYSDIDKMRKPEQIEADKKTEEMKQLINGLITYWIADTILLSSIETKHPAFTIVKKIAANDWERELVITTVLKRIQKELTWFCVILFDIVPKKECPVLPNEYLGKIDKITEMWLDWGKEKGYIK